MKLRVASPLLVLGAIAVPTLAWPTDSHAEESTTVVTQSSPSAESSTSYVGPDRRAVASGIVTFGLSYIPAVVVAASSDQSADHNLYVPVVGPWLDLGDRPGCGPGSISCDTETANKVLLVVDGVFQGLGAITTVIGLVTPERHETVVRTAQETGPAVHISPAAMGAGGYGMAAIGKF